jgi:hypothetical protein
MMVIPPPQVPGVIALFGPVRARRSPAQFEQFEAQRIREYSPSFDEEP